MSDSLRPHESQHARPPCPSPTPGVHWDSCPLSQWCHPAISSSVVPFSSCPQSLPASESFPMSQLFAWGGQSTGVSALASFLPKKSHSDLLQNGLVGSPCSPRDSQESSPTPQFKSINSSALSFLYSSTLTSIRDYWKNHSFEYIDFVSKVMSPLFTRFVIAFLPRSKYFLISWLQSPSTVILEPKKIIYVTTSTFSPPIYHEVVGLDAMILYFWMLSFKPAFSLSTFTIIKRLSSSSSVSSKWYHLHIWGCWYFSLQSWLHLVSHPPGHSSWCTLHIS